MKSYKRLLLCVITLWVIGVFCVNCIILKNTKKNERPYFLEVYQLAKEIEEAQVLGGFWSQDFKVVDVSEQLPAYQYVKRVVRCDHDEDLVRTTPYHYVIRIINGKKYRFEYVIDNANQKNVFLMVNGAFVLSLVGIMFVLLYIKKQIIDPFHRLEQVPYELSKGNLVMDLPEEKTKYFGRFVWGTNMLKDHLKSQRNKELSMHKDKKMLLLSLTHDIKTPLSVIKLNAQALSKNLYKEEEKRQNAAEEINTKVNEIEQYVTEIIDAAREDFLELEVKVEEFYLSSVINQVAEHYQGKMDLYKIDFLVDSYDDCLLHGDENRLKEVLENLLENAIKYGDGNRICLRFEREQGCSLITVSNTGSALQQEELVKVFDSFYRGSNVGTKSGNGLGLYICRKLMNNMNGDIFVKQKDDIFSATIVVKMA